MKIKKVILGLTITTLFTIGAISCTNPKEVDIQTNLSPNLEATETKDNKIEQTKSPYTVDKNYTRRTEEEWQEYYEKVDNKYIDMDKLEAYSLLSQDFDELLNEFTYRIENSTNPNENTPEFEDSLGGTVSYLFDKSTDDNAEFSKITDVFIELFHTRQLMAQKMAEYIDMQIESGHVWTEEEITSLENAYSKVNDLNKEIDNIITWNLDNAYKVSNTKFEQIARLYTKFKNHYVNRFETSLKKAKRVFNEQKEVAETNNINTL